MGALVFVRGKDGNTIGSKKTDRSTSITTIYDCHGNVVGYGDAKRDLTRSKNGNLLRWDRDPSFLLK